jgi:hypothetical protein
MSDLLLVLFAVSPVALNAAILLVIAARTAEA